MKSKKRQTALVFTGDIGFDKYMDGQWNDPELLSKGVLSFLHSGDHVIANVEGPLAGAVNRDGLTGVQQLLHTMNPAAVGVLKSMHADIWNLCNNHIMDAGEEGLAKTLEEARLAGALTIGAGMNLEDASRPLILDEAGGIGIFSVGYQRGCKPAGPEKGGCLIWSELNRIRDNIQKIKETCRWCVIVAHAGEEFTSLPSPYTRRRYLEFLDMGADIIVAHHPHVPMNYELVGDKAVFYSLGNFIFDTDYQRAQYHTEEGLLLKLCFTEESYSFEPFGLRIARGPEHVEEGPVPAIFQDVPDEEYRLLSPLAAKMFIAATKRQQIYLNPKEFKGASEEKWAEHFANPRRSGRVPGEALDFFLICPLAARAEDNEWQKSRLEGVKKYILDQMEDLPE